MRHIKLFNQYTPISENLKYHVDNNISILDNVFRPYSDSFYSLIKESREFYDKGDITFSNEDKKLFENTDIGKFGDYNNQLVPLDLPIFEEAEYNNKEVKLNYPMRSKGPKKYKVYVKNPDTGKVIKVNFGDVKGGLKAKVSDPEARKSFAARHKCSTKKDKTTPGYWACRLTKYPHLWNGKTYPGYW